MERNEKRGRDDGDDENKENENGEGRRVKKRADEDRGSLNRNREVLQKLLQESAIIAEDVVAGLEAKTEELYGALEKKTEELNAKNDLLEVNNSVMRDLTKTHQTSLQQMAVKVEEAERKVETMAAFEKCLISTMLNPDLEETVKVVKMQQEKILELERKLEEKSKVEESATPPNIGENLLKLRGINISLVKEAPKTREGVLEQGRNPNLRNDRHLKEDSSEKVDQPAKEDDKAAEEGEGVKPKELVKLSYGKVDVVRSRLAEESGKGGEVGSREDELSSDGKLRPHPDEGTKPRRPGFPVPRGLVMNSGLTVQTPGGSRCKIQRVQTPGGTTRSTASRILRQENQEEEESFDEEESDEDEQLEELLIEEQDRDDVDSLKANRQDLGFIEAEKMRRRLKRLREEKENEESRLGQLSPPSPHFIEDTVLPNIVWEEGEEERLEQEMLEECLDCTRGWVHECQEDIFHR